MTREKRSAASIILLSLLFLFIFGCDENSDPPTDNDLPAPMIGWTAGGPVDGYAVILKTTDGGVNWVRQGDSINVPAVHLADVSVVNSSVVWAAGDNVDGYGTVLRTVDGGANWMRVGTAQTIPDVELNTITAYDANTAWVAGFNGLILKTIDGGNTWTQQSANPPLNTTYQRIYALNRENVWAVGQDSLVVLHTIDGGMNWNRKENDSMIVTAGNNLIDVHAVDDNIVWVVGSHLSVFISTNAGLTWDSKSIGGLFDANGVCAFNETRAWVVVDNGIFFTSDGGNNWNVQPRTGLQKMMTGDQYILGVTAINTDNAWCVSMNIDPANKGSIFYTSDGGTTWNEQNKPANIDFRRISFVDGLR